MKEFLGKNFKKEKKLYFFNLHVHPPPHSTKHFSRKYLKFNLTREFSHSYRVTHKGQDFSDERPSVKPEKADR